jgi:hypothetical protein
MKRCPSCRQAGRALFKRGAATLAPHSREPSKRDNPRARFKENRMTIAELVYEQVKALPEQLAREVLDFVGYLRERQDDADRRDLMSAQAGSLAPVWDNAEDKVWDDA